MQDAPVTLPVLTKLQKNSTVFTAAYTTCPQSSPARASLFTGLDPSVHGLWTNGVKLPQHEQTFPQTLARSGYTNWLVGRRQLAGVANWTTEHCRPDEYQHVEWAHGPLHRSRQNAYHHWLQNTAPEQYDQIFPFQANPDDTSIPQGQYNAIADLPDNLSFNHWVGERIGELIVSHSSEQPFMAVAAFSVGSSMGAESVQGDDHDSLNKRALEQADVAIGSILSMLAADERLADTVVIVTAGRGNAEPGDSESAMLERSIKVPFIFHHPTHAPQILDSPVSIMDIAPTILDITGLSVTQRLQGSSLLGLLNGKPALRNWAMCRLRASTSQEINKSDKSRKSDDIELLHTHSSSARQRGWQTALRANHMKLVVHHGDTQQGVVSTYRLYDLKADPDEKSNLAELEAYADHLEQMIDIMIDARCALEDRTEPRIAKF